MAERFMPMLIADSQSVQFTIDVDGKPVMATVTRKCLSDKFGCNEDYSHRAVSTYLANKGAIDAVALKKYLAAGVAEVCTGDF